MQRYPESEYDDPTVPVQDGVPARPVEQQPVEPVPPLEPNRAYPSQPAYPQQYVEQQYVERPVQPVRRGVVTPAVSPAYRAAQIVYLILGILETLLVIRFILRLLAANPSAGFSSLIYGITGPFVAPFDGVFPNHAYNSSVLDWAAILAMIVYALLAWGIVKVIEIASRPTARV